MGGVAEAVWVLFILLGVASLPFMFLQLVLGSWSGGWGGGLWQAVRVR
jgi:hypothetical protein